jgi:glutamate-1-semialdehyde aminotransferase
MSKNNNFLNRAKIRIPGLTQLLSKRPDQFAPGTWPTYFSKALGTHVWDLDGKKYLDMSISGIGANVLGYCDVDVDQAVIEIIKKGNSSSLNCPEEIELAELLCDMHPWSEKVRFARTGGESMAIAVRIARAVTDKDKIVFCGYHGWHDWYLAANLSSESSLEGHLLPGLSPKGVPKCLEGTSIPFEYNNIEQLRNIFEKNTGEIAAVVMEPMRNIKPIPGFLEEVREVTKKAGAVLVFDEISSGFRLNTGGLHLIHNVMPDIAVFAKALSNGFPMAAIIGKKDIMEACQDTFISSTYWTDRIGPIAALATIRKFDKNNVSSHLIKVGKNIHSIWQEAAATTNLEITVSEGMYPISHFGFENDDNLEKMTFYVQEMLAAGILASNRFYANYCHNDDHIELYRSATEDIFSKIKQLSERDEILNNISGQLMRPGFHRFN